MKASLGILSIVILSATIVFTGCNGQTNKVEDAETSVIEADRDLEIATSRAEADLQIYRKEKLNRITENNRTIREIKQRINSESDREIKARYEVRLEQYEETNRALKLELDNYRVSDSENWDNFQDSFSSRMDNLGNSLQNFFSTSGTTSSRNQP